MARGDIGNTLAAVGVVGVAYLLYRKGGLSSLTTSLKRVSDSFAGANSTLVGPVQSAESNNSASYQPYTDEAQKQGILDDAAAGEAFLYGDASASGSEGS